MSCWRVWFEGSEERTGHWVRGIVFEENEAVGCRGLCCDGKRLARGGGLLPALWADPRVWTLSIGVGGGHRADEGYRLARAFAPETPGPVP
jgi:hypothetical protein